MIAAPKGMFQILKPSLFVSSCNSEKVDDCYDFVMVTRIEHLKAMAQIGGREGGREVIAPRASAVR